MNYFLIERKDNNYLQSKTAIEIGNYQLFTIFFLTECLILICYSHSYSHTKGNEALVILLNKICFNFIVSHNPRLSRKKKRLCPFCESNFKYQGAKKVSFTACPSGKLYLTSTSPKVILTCPKNFFRKQNKKRVILLSALSHCRIFSKSTATRE